MIENKCFQVFNKVFPFYSGSTYIGELYFLLHYSSDYTFSFSLLRKGVGSIDSGSGRTSCGEGWFSFFCEVGYKITKN